VRDLSQTEPPDLILVNIGAPFYERRNFFVQLRREAAISCLKKGSVVAEELA
jgi:hypothetical protein